MENNTFGGIVMTETAEPKPAAPSWRNRIWRIFRIVAVAYVGVVLVFLLLENNLIYYPVSAAADWQQPLDETWQDVFFSTPNGTKLHAWWCPKESSDGALIFCHGNAGNLSHRADLLPILQDEMNVSVLIFDYPGYGKSEGSPSEAECYAAGEAAYQWLTGEKKNSAERIIILGNSLGGGVATELARRHPHRALILCKTFTSMPAVGQRLYPWLPVRWLMRTRFENLSKLKDLKKPILIAHGTADPLVPYNHAEQLYESANEPKMLYTIDNGDHDCPLPVEFFRKARRFIEESEAGQDAE